MGAMDGQRSGSQALQSPEDHEATSGTELSHCLNLSLDLIVSVPAWVFPTGVRKYLTYFLLVPMSEGLWTVKETLDILKRLYF